MKTAAIIGGGFSGTVTAVNVARLAPPDIRITLINAGYPTGQGVAYSTTRAEHLLNVPARNMSALSDEPGNFVQWLAARPEFAGDTSVGERYVQRRLFGQYMLDLLQSYPRIETIAAEATDVEPSADGFRIHLAGQSPVNADAVVLATGNPAPAGLPGLENFVHPRYVANPWSDWLERLEDKNEPIVLVGGGLTMIDAFLTLSALGWTGPITAISRSGVWPLSHFPAFEYRDFPESDPTTLGLTALVAIMEEHCRRLRERGQNPAVVVDNLRPFTQRVWQNFSLADKQQFCAEYRTRWGAVRHRIASEIHEQVQAGLASGRLRNFPGRITGLSATGERIHVGVATSSGQETVDAGWVVNCTGPQESCSRSRSPLMQSLFARGLVQSDDLDLGLRVTPEFAVIGRDGKSARPIFAIGPLVRGTLWETTAVPEIRGQGRRVAERVVAALT